METELVGFTVSKYVSTDPEQREDNSEVQEEKETSDDKIDEHMDDSLLELFGIKGNLISTAQSYY